MHYINGNIDLQLQLTGYIFKNILLYDNIIDTET